MNWKRASFILIGVGAFSQAVGLTIFSFTPLKQFAVSEIIFNTEMISTFGLARFERTTPGSGGAAQTVSWILQSRACAEYAAGQMDQVSIEEVMANTRVREGGGPGAIELRVAHRDRETAIALSELILKQTQVIEREIRSRNAAALLSGLERKLASIETELSSTVGQLETHFREKDVIFTDAIESQKFLSILLSQAERELVRFSIREIHIRNVKESDTVEGLSGQSDDLLPEFSSNTDSIQHLKDYIEETLASFRRRDLTVDPVFLNLEVRKQALQRSFQDISRRVSELEVYQQVDYPAFRILSPPYIARLSGLKQVASIILINGIGGLLIGGMGVLILFRKGIRSFTA